MEYHEPVILWEAMGMPDFDTYREKSVVKGLFHPLVPKDVIDAYEVAEYMMAHAYYHWPLYDEAFTKLLLITEMAVKLRCAHFGIPIEEKRKNGSLRDRHFEQLIIDVCKAEPLKSIEERLHWLRSRRNDKMHPDSHTFSGAIMNYFAIKLGVGILNKLFIPEQLLSSSPQQIESINNDLASFFNGLFVLDTGDSRYLIEGVKAEDTLLIDGQWYYFLLASPITDKIGDQVRKHHYADLHTLQVKDIVVGDTSITMKDAATNKPIQISTTDHPANIDRYKRFNEERDDAKDDQEGIRIFQFGSAFGQQQIDFLYQWLWKVG
jgi:hypothetical protein